jgi:hypothetical protein
MCKNCAIGSKKKYGKSHIGGMDYEEKAMQALEVGAGALVGGIGAREVIKMVPATTLNSDVRDGGILLLGLAIAAFAPEEYKAGVVGLGAGMTAVAGLNLYLRHVAAAPAAALGKKKYHRVNATNQAARPVVGNVQNPVIGLTENNTGNTVSAQLEQMLLAA